MYFLNEKSDTDPDLTLNYLMVQSLPHESSTGFFLLPGTIIDKLHIVAVVGKMRYVALFW